MGAWSHLRGGGARSGVLQADRLAGWAAFAASEGLLEFGLDEDRVTRLYESYRSAGGSGRTNSIGDLTMPAAAVGHLGELACRQWLEASDETARSRAAGRADEFLAEPWTLEVLERLLGIVRDAEKQGGRTSHLKRHAQAG